MKKNRLLVAKKGPTVQEIKQLQPLADVYELNKFRTYFVIIRKSSIIGIDRSRAEATAREVARTLIASGIKCYIIAGVDDEIKFLEVNK